MIGDGVAPNTIDVGNLLIINGATLVPQQTSPVQALDASLAFAMDDQPRLAVVTNHSGLPVATGAVTLAGPAAANFTIVADTGAATLQPGDTRTITLRLQTNSIGPKGAGLRVETDGHPLRFQLSGSIFDPSLQPSFGQVVFASQPYLRIDAAQRGLTWQTQSSTNLPSWQAHRENLRGTGGPILIPRNSKVPIEFFRAVTSP
ncbi:MAG: hypothetical protein ACPGVU_07230 [Limisphaerales bacterium]